MRIVNLEEFRLLPAGVVFMKFQPCVFEDSLLVKQDTMETDFTYQDITQGVDCVDSNDFCDILFAAEKDHSISVSLIVDLISRDGLFEKNQLFAVYEQKDIDRLIGKLKKCKGA